MIIKRSESTSSLVSERAQIAPRVLRVRSIARSAAVQTAMLARSIKFSQESKRSNI